MEVEKSEIKLTRNGSCCTESSSRQGNRSNNRRHKDTYACRCESCVCSPRGFFTLAPTAEAVLRVCAVEMRIVDVNDLDTFGCILRTFQF